MESKGEMTDTDRVVKTVRLTQDAIERMISCPVSGQIYFQAVLLIGSGYTFEMEVALKLMESDNPICPITKKPITGFEVNRGMMDLVDHYLATYPNARAGQYTPNAEATDGQVPQAPPNDSRALEAQALDEPELPVPEHPAPPIPNPTVAIVNSLRRTALFRPQSPPVSYSLPIAILIKTVPVEQVDVLNGVIKLSCVSIGGNVEEKKHFVDALTTYSASYSSTLGLTFSLVVHDNCHYQFTTVITPAPIMDESQKSFFNKANFIVIFARDHHIKNIDRWIDLAKNYLPDAQLYWVDDTAVVGQRLVACQEFPRESLLGRRFPTLSRSDCNLLGLQLFEEAKTRVLNNVNGVRQEASPSPPEESNCQLM